MRGRKRPSPFLSAGPGAFGRTGGRSDAGGGRYGGNKQGRGHRGQRSPLQQALQPSASALRMEVEEIKMEARHEQERRDLARLARGCPRSAPLSPL